MDKESLYLSLSPLLQSVALNFEGWRLNKRRYSRLYADVEKSVAARGRLNGDALKDYQAQRLAAHIMAARNSPFWRQKFEQFGVRANGYRPFEELAKLPLLSKHEVREAVRSVVNPAYKREALLVRHTSGTTGSGLKFWETRSCEQETWATWWRYRGWHGISRDSWCGYFGGRSVVSLRQNTPPYWRSNYIGRQLMFSAYHLSASTARDYWTALNHSGVEWMHGYPSIISLLSQYKYDLGIDSKIRIISVGAESLTERCKSTIQRAFPETKLVQHYGQAEAVANISQCWAGSLHVDEDFSYVEFVPIPEAPGLHRIIGTNWTNPSFPLLRYDTGDIVRLAHADCACGSKWRTVRDIDGRIEDFVEIPGGAKVGRLDHIFKDMINVTEAQIRQDASGQICFLVVRGRNYTPNDEASLMNEARKRLGDEADLSIKYVDRIQRTVSGKLRLVVKEVTV